MIPIPFDVQSLYSSDIRGICQPRKRIIFGGFMDPYFRIVSKSTKRHYWQRITTNFHVHANPALYFQHFPYRTIERESSYVLYLGVGHGRVLWFSMPNAWVFINHMK
jgi:hypothetical protein